MTGKVKLERLFHGAFRNENVHVVAMHEVPRRVGIRLRVSAMNQIGNCLNRSGFVKNLEESSNLNEMLTIAIAPVIRGDVDEVGAVKLCEIEGDELSTEVEEEATSGSHEEQGDENGHRCRLPPPNLLCGGKRIFNFSSSVIKISNLSN